MKLYWGSTAIQLAYQIAYFGNIPYSALKLYPYPYESAKDAIQKLIRAGYVGTVKAPHVKSLYITPKGFKAVDEARLRRGRTPMMKTPIDYHPRKAARTDKINEAHILFYQAGLGNYYNTCRTLKRQMELEYPRSSDNLKYSRFVGLWRKEEGCALVYHYGRGNIQLNKNGERNALQMAAVHSSPVSRLILGNSADTLLSMLLYSQWVVCKTERQRGHMKHLHFHISPTERKDKSTVFLPVSREAVALLPYIGCKAWGQWVDNMTASFKQEGQTIWNPLHCEMQEPLVHLLHPEWSRTSKILVLCYEWQEKLVKSLYGELADRKEIWVQVLPTRAVVSVLWEQKDIIPVALDAYRL